MVVGKWKFITGVLVAGWVLTGSVRADGMVIPPAYRQVEETGQRAVVWWDGKKETLIVSVTFKGDTRDFAWVIPAPSKPEVRAGKDELFTALEDYTRPKPADDYPQPLGMGMMRRMNIEAPADRVTVYQTKRVDIYDIAVLGASDSDSLREWLVRNGYEYPEDREYLLKAYVDKGWYFVAAKVSDEASGFAGSFLREGHATPLVMTFASDQMVYPLKISGPATVALPTLEPILFPTRQVSSLVLAGFSFENSMNYWNKYSSDPTEYLLGGAIELSSDQALYGDKSLKISGPQKQGDLYVYSGISGLAVGKVHTYSAYVKASAKLGTARLKVQRVGYSSEWESQRIPLSGLKNWTRIELPFNPIYDNYEFDLIVNNMDAKGEVYWDGVQVEVGIKATEFGGEKVPAGNVASREYCQSYDGNISGCDLTSKCAYYYCSDRCWPEGTPNSVACPGQRVSYLQDTAQNIVIYAFSNHKQAAPGWNAEYAGYMPAKQIEKLAVDSSGDPWVKTSKKMYLTKLTRRMRPAEMVDDVILRQADDNKPVGGGAGGINVPWRTGLILVAPLVAEVLVIGYIVYRRRYR